MLPTYDDVLNQPSPAPLPTLQLTAAGRLTISQALMEALHLQNGSRINLVPPVFGSEYWHLDCRPTAPRAIEWHLGGSPRVKGIDLPAWLVPKAIRLMLVPGLPHSPNYYPLLPAHAYAA
jgi:hypothetical protein